MIYCISDLHYGSSEAGDRAVRALATRLVCESTEADILLVGGDIASDDDAINACLSLFKPFAGTRAAIAGNHDVWVEAGRSSWDRYERLPGIFRKAGFHALEEEPLRIGSLGIVGAMGWYDGSFREDIGVPDASYERKFDPTLGIGWGDGSFVHWQYSDQEMTGLQAERLERQLETVRGCDRVIALVHHLPTKRLLFHPRWLVPRQWRFANAYLGADRFSEVINRYRNVCHIVNGHIHMSRSVIVGGQRYSSIGGDYENKQLLLLDGDRTARRTFSG